MNDKRSAVLELNLPPAELAMTYHADTGRVCTQYSNVMMDQKYSGTIRLMHHEQPFRNILNLVNKH